LGIASGLRREGKSLTRRPAMGKSASTSDVLAKNSKGSTNNRLGSPGLTVSKIAELRLPVFLEYLGLLRAEENLYFWIAVVLLREYKGKMKNEWTDFFYEQTGYSFPKLLLTHQNVMDLYVKALEMTRLNSDEGGFELIDLPFCTLAKRLRKIQRKHGDLMCAMMHKMGVMLASRHARIEAQRLIRLNAVPS